MKIVHGDLRAPGACMICLGNPLPQGGHMIETGARNDYGIINERSGEIYICSNCSKGIAELEGFVSPDSVQDLKSEIDKLTRDGAGAEGALDAIQRIIHDTRPAAAEEQ